MRQELQPRESSRIDDWNAQTRANVLRALQGMAQWFVRAPGPPSEIAAADNANLLLVGKHGGFRLEKPDTRIVGAVGAVITRRVLVRADAEFDGLHFTSESGSDNVLASLVDVDATSTAVFRGCRFTRRLGDGAAWLSVSAGGRVHFVGCIFDGQPGNSNVVDNPGAIGNVGVLGSNRTGRPLGNATTIFVTT